MKLRFDDSHPRGYGAAPARLSCQIFNINGATAGKSREPFEATDIVRCSAVLPNDPFVLKINNKVAQ